MGIRRLEPEEVLDPDEEPEEDPELEDPPVDVEEEPEEDPEEEPEEDVGGLDVGGEEVGGLDVGGVDVGGLGGARRRGAVTLVNSVVLTNAVELVALQPEAMARRLKRATNRIRIL